MATITKEQAMKRQAAAPTGWRYDWKHYVLWGENQITRSLNQDDGSILTGAVSFREIYETRTNEYGCRWNVPTGKYCIELRVSRWVESGSGAWVSHGLGKTMRLGLGEFTRKTYKDLCKTAATVTDEMITGLHQHGAEIQSLAAM